MQNTAANIAENNATEQVPEQPRYSVRLAVSDADVLASQRLRYQVFAEEMGADVGADSVHQVDRDEFDPHCVHMLVTETSSGKLVASTRLLNRAGAEAVGSYYSETEFDMSAIKALDGDLLEVGRTCVREGYRTGAVIATLWQGLAAHIIQNNIPYMIGCASIEWGTDGSMIHAVTRRLQQKYLVNESLRVIPRVAVPNPDSDCIVTALQIPPLMKAYVSLGAKICGEPSWDPAFGVADLFVLLRTEDLSPRYARHFIERQQRQ